MTPRYELTHRTHAALCAWCWEPIDAVGAHTVVQRGGAIELHLHHRCWPVYRSLSGIEGAETTALYREWKPQRIEALRLHAGMTLAQFAGRLGVQVERLTQVLRGERRLGQKQLARLRGLAVDLRFERQEQAGHIDWADRRACFCLCARLRWTGGQLARRLGVTDQTVTAWWDRGVPRHSVRHWSRLTNLARQHDFDSGMLVDDRLWTPDLLREALRASGLTYAAFAAAGGTGYSTVRDALGGRVTRLVAYYLTTAAARLSLPLPPTGYIPPKRRTRPVMPEGMGGADVRAWKPEELALLGTMPDRAVAERLPGRTWVAVRRIRRILGIKRIDNQKWDGAPQPPPVPTEEVLERYRQYLRGELARKAGLR